MCNYNTWCTSRHAVSSELGIACMSCCPCQGIGFLSKRSWRTCSPTSHSQHRTRRWLLSRRLNESWPGTWHTCFHLLSGTSCSSKGCRRRCSWARSHHCSRTTSLCHPRSSSFPGMAGNYCRLNTGSLRTLARAGRLCCTRPSRFKQCQLRQSLSIRICSR